MISVTSPTKRARRTKREIESLKEAIYDLVSEEQPMTVRQVFYRLVSSGVIGKAESEYKNVVCRLLKLMRKAKELPFGWITDNTRWQRKPDTYNSLAEMLDLTQETYRRAIWSNQGAYVEVWLEKEALAGVLYQTTGHWDVPLMVCRGYPSLSFLHSAAEDINELEKPAYLYYFGDWDPSGVDISRVVERELREFATDAEIHFERVAVNQEQITTLNLPTRPTKKTDSRRKSFEGESVEVDAIPPQTLREMVWQCITQHIDDDSLQRMEAVEAAERQTLARMADDLFEDEE